MKKFYCKMSSPLALLLLLATPRPTVFGQGALTPPGAPAPTMKSLDQIEARTAITNRSSRVTISQPGSYYLTGNLTVSTGDGIDINTNGVTLDLNGFTITSTAASAQGYGILLNANLNNITIFNGHIQGSVTNNGSGIYNGGGFNSGVLGLFLPGNKGKQQNVGVSRISVSGCLLDGIFLNSGNSVEVEACTVRTVGGEGIYAGIVKDSVALDCGGDGILGDQVFNCRGQTTGSSYGLLAGESALNCAGSSVGDFGLYAGITAENCYGSSVSGDGVVTSTAQNCVGFSTSGTGLVAATALNCLGQSSSNEGLNATIAQNCSGICTSTGTGLDATAAQNCYGECDGTGIGLNAANASFCAGSHSGGTAINATIATGCYAAVGTNIITYKYNMP